MMEDLFDEKGGEKDKSNQGAISDKSNDTFFTRYVNEIVPNLTTNLNDKILKDLSSSYPVLSEDILYNHILPSFNEEEKFIRSMRPNLSKFIVCLIKIQIFLLFVIPIVSIFFSFFNKNFKFDTGIYSVLATAVFANTVGLMAILFKYIFNRSENKILEILDSFLKTRADYESKNYDKFDEEDK